MISVVDSSFDLSAISGTLFLSVGNKAYKGSSSSSSIFNICNCSSFSMSLSSSVKLS